MAHTDAQAQLRDRVTGLIADHLDEAVARWADRMRGVLADHPVAARISAAEYEAGMREMLPLLLARLRDPQDERCLALVDQLAEQAYAAGMSAGHVGRWWIALERAIDGLLEEHLGGREGEVLAAHYVVEDEIDPLRLRVNATYYEISQRELLASETRHRALLRDASDAILTMDPHTGRLVAANLRALELTGYSLPELAEIDFADLWPGEERGAAQEQLARLSALGSLRLPDIVLRRKDGSGVPVDVAANIIEAGGVLVGQAIVRDISDRKALERQRQEHEAELERRVAERTAELEWMTSLSESIIEAVPAPLLVVSRDRKVLRADQRFMDEQGLSLADVRGRDLGELFGDDLLHQGGVLDAVNRCLETGQPHYLEGVRHTGGTHAEKILNFRFQCVASDGRRDVVIIWDDVTAAAKRTHGLSLLYQLGKAMQGALELGRLLHAVLTCVTAGPAAGLGFNRAVLLLRNKRTGELKGRMGVGPKDAEEAHRIWSETSRKAYELEDFLATYDDLDTEALPLNEVAQRLGAPHGDTCATREAIRERRAVHVTPDAAERYAGCAQVLGTGDFVVVPLISRDEAIGVIVADNLYSGRRIEEEDIWLLEMFAAQAGQAIVAAETYQELQQKLEELEKTQQKLLRQARLAAVGEMAARVAHEIRNPLTTIGGFARVVIRDATDVEKNRQSARVIVEEVDRLELILGNLLSFTRPHKPALQPVDVNDVLEDTRALVVDDFDGRPRRLELDLGELPPTLGDRGQLKQVFINLAKNAAQAMPEGGRLRITSAVEGDEIRVAFADEGHGIPEGIAADIFEPFFTTRTVGSGIGLAVTRQIVEDHGGRLEVSSREEEGSTFTVVLPVRRPVTEAPMPLTPPEGDDDPSGPS